MFSHMTVGNDVRLPDGVLIRPLSLRQDTRGTLIEIFRAEWCLGCEAIQFNTVTSRAGVLRGVHVHVRHWDHIVVVAGRMLLGLHDLRSLTGTYQQSCMIELDADKPSAVVIPPGVAHGFYFPQSSILVYGTSHYWDVGDEIACRWSAPQLQLDWQDHAPIVSDRDAAADDYPTFLAAFKKAWAAVHGGDIVQTSQ
jgi:dTDP-4-dehydrorhamnose 3,5-epimerase